MIAPRRSHAGNSTGTFTVSATSAVLQNRLPGNSGEQTVLNPRKPMSPWKVSVVNPTNSNLGGAGAVSLGGPCGPSGPDGPCGPSEFHEIGTSRSLHCPAIPTIRSLPVLASTQPWMVSALAWIGAKVKTKGIGHRRMKDLRDTFASQLLTAGVQLGYVSQQLGHADVAVTARHYARWAGGDIYREPLRLEPGEVPADLLARLAESPQKPPHLAGDPRSTFENSPFFKGIQIVDGGSLSRDTRSTSTRVPRSLDPGVP
jgi:hypothetical protein